MEHQAAVAGSQVAEEADSLVQAEADSLEQEEAEADSLVQEEVEVAPQVAEEADSQAVLKELIQLMLSLRLGAKRNIPQTDI